MAYTIITNIQSTTSSFRRYKYTPLYFNMED